MCEQQRNWDTYKTVTVIKQLVPILLRNTKIILQTSQTSDISYSCRSVAILMLYLSTTVRIKPFIHEIPYSKFTFAIRLQVLEILGFCFTEDKTVTMISPDLKHKYESLCDSYMKVPWMRDSWCFLLTSLYPKAQP